MTSIAPVESFSSDWQALRTASCSICVVMMCLVAPGMIANDAEDGVIVGFGAAAGEDDFLGTGADERGDLFASGFDGGSGRAGRGCGWTRRCRSRRRNREAWRRVLRVRRVWWRCDRGRCEAWILAGAQLLTAAAPSHFSANTSLTLPNTSCRPRFELQGSRNREMIRHGYFWAGVMSATGRSQWARRISKRRCSSRL